MAKVQNTFIKSKMNKDLDDRILSKGEYRNAQNVNVSKSEGSDVGAMENVLGNVKLNSFVTDIDGAVIIGELMDFTNERIFVMITNYTDVNGNTNNVNYAPAGAYCALGVYDLNTFQTQILVRGSFLNFSTTNLINGINLIEDLLFWTDDRNQPRKINVNLALSADADSANPHYINEDQVSLAKYYPFKTPILFNNVTINNVVSGNTSNPGADIALTGASVENLNGSSLGDTVISLDPSTIGATENIFVGMAISGGNIPAGTSIVAWDISTSTVTISNALTSSDAAGTTYTITWKLTNSNSVIKAGMFVVLDSAIQVQSQNIQISEIVNDTTISLSSTNTVQLIFGFQTIKLYFPTSYTKNKKFLAPSMAGFITSGITQQPFNQAQANSFIANFNGTPKVGMLISCSVGGSTATSIAGTMADNTTISGITSNGSNSYTITTNKNFDAGTLLAGCSVLLSDPNPYYNLTWPGDPDYLENKFVRFAYRFKFEDGEYSLMSPFTQPCFIPKQDGYITTGLKKSTIFQKISKSEPGSSSDYSDGNNKYLDFNYSNLSSQESNLAKSTVVAFFENRVQEVDIQIPCEYTINKLNKELNIIEIDVLYKESDGLQVKVLDTLATTDTIISSNNTKILTYNYQSRKPFRNLTDAEVVRVYDKIPVRAKTQSVTGNRVVFGNFYDKPTPPLTLDYAVSVTEKFRIDSTNGTNNGFSNVSAALAYPNHSVKQNRTYQIGVILQDKYGRSSDVVLSSLGEKTIQFPAGSGGDIFSGSTIFHNYRLSTENIYNWFGDSIKMLWQNGIPESVSYASGYPGIYRSGEIDLTVSQGSSTDILELANSWDNDIVIGSIVQGTLTNGNKFSKSIIAFDNISTPPTITLNTATVISANTAVKVIGNANPLGWYSYKIVVKQSAEDYYNAYLPNSLAGTTQYSISEASNLSHITLTADNINKIPSDITEATPEQTQFRSSDEVLFPRVAAQNWNTFSQQITVSSGENPTRSRFFTVDAIGKTTDLGLNTSLPGEAIRAAGIYDAISDPTVAKLRTYGTSFGGFYNNPTNPGDSIPSNVSTLIKGDASFFGINVLFGNRIQLDDPDRRGAAITGWMFPNPDSRWKNEEETGFTGAITAGSTGWGYLSNNNATGVNDSIKTSTNSKEGSGMRVRAMCVGPNNDTGKFTTPFTNGNLSNMYWRIETSGAGYKVGDVITVPPISSSSTDYTNWSDEIQFTLEEGHLNTPESSQNIPGLPISVMEVKPADSNLDIYWETSTSGSVKELNSVIAAASAISQPTALDFTSLGTAKNNVYFPENTAANSFIAKFTCLNGINGTLGAASFNLDSVLDGSGNNVSGDFGLTQNPNLNGDNEGNIYPTSAKFFNSNDDLNNFTFNVTVTNISLGIAYTNTFSFPGRLGNLSPTIVDITGGTPSSSDFTITSQGGTVDLFLYAINGSTQGQEYQQIKWQLNEENPGGTWSFLDGQGGASTLSNPLNFILNRNRVRIYVAGLQNGTYQRTFKVTDAAGNGLSTPDQTITLIVQLPAQEGGSTTG